MGATLDGFVIAAVVGVMALAGWSSMNGDSMGGDKAMMKRAASMKTGHHDGQQVMRSRLLVIAAVLCAAASGGVVMAAAQPLSLGQPAPDVAGDRWINGPPLTIAGLRGQVVLVEFWTYG